MFVLLGAVVAVRLPNADSPLELTLEFNLKDKQWMCSPDSPANPLWVRLIANPKFGLGIFKPKWMNLGSSDFTEAAHELARLLEGVATYRYLKYVFVTSGAAIRIVVSVEQNKPQVLMRIGYSPSSPQLRETPIDNWQKAIEELDFVSDVSSPGKHQLQIVFAPQAVDNTIGFLRPLRVILNKYPI